jgi:cytochrome c peroxidase
MRAAIVLALTACTTAPVEESWQWSLPAGFPAPEVPVDNPMTEDKVELGRMLFFDTRLSADGTQSCASCHDPARAFTDGRAVPIGVTGEAGHRNSMTLVNVAYASSLTWAADVESLEDQALRPMLGTSPVELGVTGHEAEVLARFTDDTELFVRAGEDISLRGIARAIATYERTLIRGDTPFDRFIAGDKLALSPSAQRGLAAFESRGCADCHSGFTLSSSFGDARVFDDGIGEGKFKAPTLRNITRTAPYFHDGSAATLDDVLDHYAVVADQRADFNAFFAALSD